MNLTKEQIIDLLQQGEKVSLEQYYPVFYPEIQQYIEIKKHTVNYKIDQCDWDDLELEVLQGLIYAFDHFDHTKNSDFEGWYKTIIKQFFDREQNKILKKRIKEQEAFEKLASEQIKNKFPSEEIKLEHINKIKDQVLNRKNKNPKQAQLALDLFLHFFGYYGPFGRELEDETSDPKSLEDLMNFYEIKDKNRIATLITAIQRIIISNDYRKLDEMSLLKRSPLTELDYKVLDFIIEQNNKTDSKGDPLCPNSTDFIKKGRFEFDIRSRTTLSESIRRIKDAGFRFAEQEERNSSQGYFLLNPELYNSLGMNEKVAIAYLKYLISQQPDGPVKSGVSMLFDRIAQKFNTTLDSLENVIGFNSEKINSPCDSVIFENLCVACQNRTKADVTFKSSNGVKVVCGIVEKVELNGDGIWIATFKTQQDLIQVPVEKITSVTI